MELGQSRVVILVVVVLALLAGSFLAGRAIAGSRVVRAQDPIAFAAPADPNWASNGCTSINNVAAFDNRIHVRCATPNGPIEYYAYPTSGSNGYTANRMLAVGQTAFALGKGGVIFYQTSASYNPTDCYMNDCRLLTGLSILN